MLTARFGAAVSPRNRKMTRLMPSAGPAVQNMLRMCWHGRARRRRGSGTRIVVSESGVILSPKYAPQITAPAAAASDDAHHLRHADERHAERAGRRPRAAGDHPDERADRRGREEEHVRVEQLDAVVDDGRDRAGHVPGADQRADREQDEDRADGGRHAADRRVGHGRGRIAVLERDQARERRAEQQRDLQRPVGGARPEQADRQRDQRDQDDHREDRVEQGRRPRRRGPVHRRPMLDHRPSRRNRDHPGESPSGPSRHAQVTACSCGCRTSPLTSPGEEVQVPDGVHRPGGRAAAGVDRVVLRPGGRLQDGRGRLADARDVPRAAVVLGLGGDGAGARRRLAGGDGRRAGRRGGRAGRDVRRGGPAVRRHRVHLPLQAALGRAAERPLRRREREAASSGRGRRGSSTARRRSSCSCSRSARSSR